jgi:shikimate 5-dehydrogenase
VLSNLAHGAWALEQGNGVVARGRCLAQGAGGMAGSIAFAMASCGPIVRAVWTTSIILLI